MVVAVAFGVVGYFCRFVVLVVVLCCCCRVKSSSLAEVLLPKRRGGKKGNGKKRHGRALRKTLKKSFSVGLLLDVAVKKQHLKTG